MTTRVHLFQATVQPTPGDPTTRQMGVDPGVADDEGQVICGGQDIVSTCTTTKGGAHAEQDGSCLIL